VRRWCVLIDEFSATFKHKAGEENVIADALSRVPTTTSFTNTSTALESFIYSQHKDATLSPCNDDTVTTADETCFDYNSDSDSDSMSPFEYPSYPPLPTLPPHDVHPMSHTDDAHPVTTRSATRGSIPRGPLHKGNDFKEIDIDQLRKLSTTWKAEGVLVNPNFDEAGRDPTTTIRYYQQRDDAAKQLALTNPDEFGIINLNSADVICKHESDDDFCLVLTTEMLKLLVHWCHTVTVHATGTQTLLHAMKQPCYHKKLTATLNPVTSSCATCKISKKTSQQYGLLSPWYSPLE